MEEDSTHRGRAALHCGVEATDRKIRWGVMSKPILQAVYKRTSHLYLPIFMINAPLVVTECQFPPGYRKLKTPPKFHMVVVGFHKFQSLKLIISR